MGGRECGSDHPFQIDLRYRSNGDCTCAIGLELERRLDKRRAPAAAGDEITIWTLTKAGHFARAVTRTVPGIGVELRFVWDDDTRATQVYRNTVELAQAASAKREELIAAGWVDAPPHWAQGPLT
jgi:hypothetical protein